MTHRLTRVNNTSQAVVRYLVYFWFPIVAFGDNGEPKESRFHAAAGEKILGWKPPRKSYQ